MRRIVIVGGGFCGGMTAAHVARLVDGPARIEVVEPRATLGAGLAYSATDPAHRINVPAARMTVFTDDPLQFDRWLRDRPEILRADPGMAWVDGSLFPNRAVFGSYMAAAIAAAGTAQIDVAIAHRRTDVTAVEARPAGFRVHLASGGALEADVVVLAVTHPPPAVPYALRRALTAGAPVVANPWAEGALDGLDAGARVLMVGTGLTMADVVGTLAQRGHTGPILAISRRGLLSRGHVFGDVAKREWFTTAKAPTSAASLTQAVRAQVREAAADGVPWQAVFDDARANAARLWAALPEREQRRLLRHVRPFWDVHRFRVAPQLAAAIHRLRATGQLQVRAASVAGADWNGTALRVQLRPRHARAAEVMTQAFDAVVVATGPAHDRVMTANPVLASLARQGVLQPDGLGLGVKVDARSRAVGVDGTARADLLVAGPLARGQFGELMGLPQVSEHALAVAWSAVAALSAQTSA